MNIKKRIPFTIIEGNSLAWSESWYGSLKSNRYVVRSRSWTTDHIRSLHWDQLGFNGRPCGMNFKLPGRASSEQS